MIEIIRNNTIDSTNWLEANYHCFNEYLHN